MEARSSFIAVVSPQLLLLCAGIHITHRGLPYRGSTWHFLYSDHQSFVEELARTITTSDPPSPGPYIPLELTNGGVIEADPSWVPGVPIET